MKNILIISLVLCNIGTIYGQNNADDARRLANEAYRARLTSDKEIIEEYIHNQAIQGKRTVSYKIDGIEVETGFPQNFHDETSTLKYAKDLTALLEKEGFKVKIWNELKRKRSRKVTTYYGVTYEAWIYQETVFIKIEW